MQCVLKTPPVVIRPKCLSARVTSFAIVPLNHEASTLLAKYGHTFANLSPDTVQRQYRRATQRLGFKDVSFHTLRHTTASRLAQAGVGLLQLQQFMGHANVSTTQRYAHLAPNWADDVVSLLH